jgi:para-nitrobenzyl esterase
MIKQTKTENGMVRGVSAADPRIIAYKGIPFAAPPVGSLRWKAPQPTTGWAGVRDCIEFAPVSMQISPAAIIYTRANGT